MKDAVMSSPEGTLGNVKDVYRQRARKTGTVRSSEETPRNVKDVYKGHKKVALIPC
jgi:hypothetical protein